MFSALTQHVYAVILSRYSWYTSTYRQRIIKDKSWIINAGNCGSSRAACLHADGFPVWVEVFLQRLPAFVVALVQTLARLQPPLGDRHAEGRLEHEGLRKTKTRGTLMMRGGPDPFWDFNVDTLKCTSLTRFASQCNTLLLTR